MNNSTNLPAKAIRIGALSLLLALLLFPCRLSAEAAMTLRTATLIDRYAESHRQVSSRAQAATKGVPTTAADDSDAESTVGVMLSVADTFDLKRLTALGVSVGVCVNGVVTARATPAQLAQAAQLDGIFFIDADNRARRKLNVAVPLIGADVAQRGGGTLTQAYTGKGVVIGVVDWGFDFTHETFRDTLGNLRIARVWNQSSSRRPGNSNDSVTFGFTYGAMYAAQSEILNLQCSSTETSHGTHVAGIAAGLGDDTGKYRGVAPDAELVLVHLKDGTTAELIDGLKYIFSYAQRAGKPAVVNFSLGSHDGPHDGTSSFDLALEGLAGSGRIAVGAAGNEGSSKLHASHTFSKSGEVVRTIVGVAEGKSEVRAYAPADRQLSWTVELWDVAKRTRLQQASGENFYSTQTGDKPNEKSFISNATETVKVLGSGYNSYGNVRRGIVELNVTNNKPDKYAVALVLKMAQDKTGTVHLWNLGNEDEGGNASFGTLKNSTYTWIDGDGDYTVGEIGGVSKSIISVGSYNNHKNGSISSFSSKGPATDGRVKPDLIAPGSSLISAYNKYDRVSTFGVSPKDKEYDIFLKGYVRMQGTSMSTPMVTGAVALLLQKNPTLTPDSVRCILQQNATLDASINTLSQNTRGAGKLDILKAMENGVSSACMLLSAPQSLWSDNRQAVEFKIIPNPNNGIFTIDTEEDAANLTLSVYNLMGVLLYSNPVQPNGSVELSFLPHGLYVVQLRNGKKTGAKKMLLYR